MAAYFYVILATIIPARSQNNALILNNLLGEWLKTACGTDTLPDNGDELFSFYCVASSHLLRFLEPLTQEQVICFWFLMFKTFMIVNAIQFITENLLQKFRLTFRLVMT